MTEQEREKALLEGGMLEHLTQQEGWDVLMAKLKQKDESLSNKYRGIVHDLDQVNFDNGQRRGLQEPLSIVEKAIKLKEAALKELEDAAGG